SRSDAAMVAIADGKGLSQRVLEGDVLPLVVAHRVLGLELRPEPELALVPRRLGIGESMRGAGYSQGTGGLGVEVVGRNFYCAVGLIPHRLPGFEGNGTGIAQAADAAHGAK